MNTQFNLNEFNKKTKTNLNLNIPKGNWKHQWGIDSKNGSYIYNLIIEKKPEIIIETGTFEGQGTYVLAKAAHENNNNCKIYTIDYDGDPTSSQITKEEWLELKSFRDTNLEKIKNEFPNCEVIFLDGDSRQMIPKIFNEYGETKCDFFYQDSMHFHDGILSEWRLVEPFLIKNSLTLFDDLQLKGVRQFRDWFIKTYKTTYDIIQTTEGHQQLIVCKI